MMDAAREQQIRSRPFPIQRTIGVRGMPPDPHPTSIPWSVAEKAYGVYSDRYGRDQSLERLAERGGFGAEEMDMFHPGWRDEVSEIVALRERVATWIAAREAWATEPPISRLSTDAERARAGRLLRALRDAEEGLVALGTGAADGAAGEGPG